ncbi:hypothetical protein D3C75_1182130 [compost metagenome]
MYAFVNGPHHDGLIARRALFQHGVKMILIAQGLEKFIAAEQADLTNPPVAAVTVEYLVG